MTNADSPSGSKNADNPGSGPVGKGDYVVAAGDCIFSIAYEAGLNWETVWNHADNADLKRIRQYPNRLLPGDRVTIPSIQIKKESRPTEQRHKFKLKNVPAKLILRLMKPPDISSLKDKEQAGQSEDAPGHNISDKDPDPPDKQEDEPWASVTYRLEIEGKVYDGQTDSDGKLTVSIVPNARTGTLFLNTDNYYDGGPVTITLNLGALAPHDELMGIKQRLLHLTFDCGDLDNDQQSDALAAAVAAFREKHGLDPGGIDQDLIDKLKEEHGS